MVYTKNANNMQTKKNIRANIKENKIVCPGNMRMVLDVDNKSFGAMPGQFVMLKTSEDGASDPILRRPFGVLRCGGQLEILYKVVGKGTAWMASKKPGDSLEVMGPLGNGFDCEPFVGKHAVLVAGGIGIAPLFALAEYLTDRNSLVTMFYGAASSDDLPLIEQVRDMGVTLHIATEDGSVGERGLVTELMAKNIKSCTVPEMVVAACGPFGMMRAVYSVAQENKLPCCLSLDCRMACGFGVCSGCAVEVHASGGFAYKRVCREGPVFNGDDLLWE